MKAINKWLDILSERIGNPSEEIVKSILSALEHDQPVWLATVLSTWGSSPRPPGAMMLWSETTGIVGSVSGGCIEEDLIRKFREASFTLEKPSQTIYGESKDDARNFQLPCGGKLCLLIEPIANSSASAQWQDVQQLLSERKGVKRIVKLDDLSWSYSDAAAFPVGKTSNVISYYIGPQHKLLIVGGNQIATYLAQFCETLGFVVTVCDPNNENAQSWSQRDFRFLQQYPDGLVEGEFSDSASAVVAVSHDPRLDDMALLEALPCDCFYIGAMGSVRTSAARRERLEALGVQPNLLQKLIAPVGVEIGSKSPAEIAISIAADLIRVQKNKTEVPV